MKELSKNQIDLILAILWLVAFTVYLIVKDSSVKGV